MPKYPTPKPEAPVILNWHEYVVPIPTQRQRLIQITNIVVGTQIFFDPISHYLFKEEYQEHGRSRWYVVDLPCNRGKPK